MSPSAKHQRYDVIVVGAGNAALVTALSAHEAGARVLVLEKAPKTMRGGSTYLTGGGFRFVHNGMETIRDLVPDLSEDELRRWQVFPYSADEYYNDFMRVTDGLANPELIEVLVAESNPTVRWMVGQGLKLEIRSSGVLHIGERLVRQKGSQPLEAKGGGAGLEDMYFDIAEQKGIEIRYQTKATKLMVNSSGVVCGVTIKDKEGFHDIGSKAVVLACGGFEANPEMRAKYLGNKWDTVKIRGTKYDTGDGHIMAMQIGAQPTGQWTGCHATNIDAEAPDIADRATGDKTSRTDYQYSIIVNSLGKRFVDEGEDIRHFTYAKLGRNVLAQPQGIAFQIFDSKVKHLLQSRYATGRCVTADSIEELAENLEIDSESLTNTLKEFNAAVQKGSFDPTIKDGKGTVGISPPKTNWAQELDSPPFEAYPVMCAITFTFGGLKINRRAQVLDTEDEIIPGLYAAGEIVGGLFYNNYPGGTGIMAGAVFGRIAGATAASEGQSQ
ncbi:FAD-dependent tricarballylate dehydrogenase TcuA [Chloroflexota bacterium]